MNRRGFVWVAALALTGLAAPSAAPQDFGKIFSDVLHQRLPGDTRQLSKGEVTNGLKEALVLATDRASNRLGAKDGFFLDPAVRIGLPGVLGSSQERLKPFGMSGPLDDLQLRINRGAEAAMPSARKLVTDAIKSMTIQDGVKVLRGGDTAATDLLRQKTEAGLKQSLAPYVESALADSGALTSFDSAVTRYGGGLVKADGKTTLTNHAVDYAVEGLFQYVSQEEKAIRQDPVKRTSELLRKVFGG